MYDFIYIQKFETFSPLFRKQKTKFLLLLPLTDYLFLLKTYLMNCHLFFYVNNNNIYLCGRLAEDTAILELAVFSHHRVYMF